MRRTVAGGAGGGEEACSGGAADERGGAAAGAGGGADAAQGRQRVGLLRRVPQTRQAKALQGGGEARWQAGAPGQLRHRQGGGAVHRSNRIGTPLAPRPIRDASTITRSRLFLSPRSRVTIFHVSIEFEQTIIKITNKLMNKYVLHRL